MCFKAMETSPWDIIQQRAMVPKCIICSMVGAQAQDQSTCVLAPVWPRMDHPKEMRTLLEAVQSNPLGQMSIILVSIESRFREHDKDAWTTYPGKSSVGACRWLFACSFLAVSGLSCCIGVLQCSALAQLHHSMWDLTHPCPRPGMEPMCPPLDSVSQPLDQQ